MRKTFLPTIAPAMALSLAACDNTGGDLSAQEAVATAEVSVVDNGFEPSAIEVSAGDTVTWTWSGSAPHDVDGEGVQSEVQSTGSSQHTSIPSANTSRCATSTAG